VVTPVRFNAAGWYRGELRREILRLKRHQDVSVLKAMTFALKQTLPVQGSPWFRSQAGKRRKRANPLPALICQSLGRTTKTLAETLSAHRGPTPSQSPSATCEHEICFRDPSGSAILLWFETPIWIVDDILTSGATAKEALKR
jgi:predicted amidophosphoribosyltransferase